MDDIESQYEKIKNYDFDFQHLAFEGGGVKMGAYIGVVKVLEVMGILQRCHKFAGTSGGAIVAMLLAINTNATDLHEFLTNLPVNDLVTDSKMGKFALLPNLIRHFGWNPAKLLLEAFRKELKRVTGNPDITFLEIYERYGNTLCLPVTNVSTMSVEYFHPKTTPHVPVALAVRASGSLPGYMKPVCIKGETGFKQYYTDGGLLCNFPVHAFDGWYLSMDPKDSFFARIGDSGDFKEFNPQTLGFVLYTPWEGEFMQGELHARYKESEVKRPNTPLARERGAKCDRYLAENTRNQRIMDAAKRFLSNLREMDIDHNFVISVDEFKNAFDKLEMNEGDVELLFGSKDNFLQAFVKMDVDGDQNITFDEFLMLLQNHGLDYKAVIEGGCMVNITSFGEFLGTTFNTLLNNSRKVYHKQDDIHRSAGIYTDYVDTADFVLHRNDQIFLINQGMRGCLSYFQHLVDMHQKGRLPASMANVVSKKPASEKNSLNAESFVMNITEEQDADAEYFRNTHSMKSNDTVSSGIPAIKLLPYYISRKARDNRMMALAFVLGMAVSYIICGVLLFFIFDLRNN